MDIACFEMKCFTSLPKDKNRVGQANGEWVYEFHMESYFRLMWIHLLHSSAVSAPYMSHAAGAPYMAQMGGAMDMSAYQNANANMPPGSYPMTAPSHQAQQQQQQQQQQAAFYQQPLL